MERYVYAGKGQVAEARGEFESVLYKARSFIRRNDPDLNFIWEPVGGIGRDLVVCKKGDQSFDLEYNLILESPGYGYGWVGKKVYSAFLDAFRHAVEGTGCSIGEESGSLIRIESADGVMGCEFAVVYYESPTHLWCLRSHKNEGYSFMRHRLNRNVDAATDRIIEDSPGNWSKVRKRYLRLKNSDRKGRSSYLLYAEAVSGVYRQLFGDLDRPKPLSRQCLASIIDSYI